MTSSAYWSERWIEEQIRPNMSKRERKALATAKGKHERQVVLQRCQLRLLFEALAELEASSYVATSAGVDCPANAAVLCPNV